jgi:hypothetical protein
MTKMVKLEQIRLDGGTQFRDQIDQNTVKHYTDCMRDGAEFPAIKCTFDGAHYWLWDGFHRYFASQGVGFKEVLVEYKPGTQEDAQDLALSANGKHGLPRNNATKRKQVETALSMERHAGKSDREIAKLCDVSHTFVASVRNPEAKERQANNVAKHFENKATPDNESGVKLQPPPEVEFNSTPPGQDYGPDADELKANELAEQADREIFVKLLESDDALQVAHKEILRLNSLLAQKQIRITSLMNEKNAAVKQIKTLESQLKKATKK